MREATDPLKTQRVYLLLRDQIAGGQLPAGTRLPAEPALADAYSVSRVTIRRALDRLAAEELIDKRPGSGTFVRKDEAKVQTIVADVANVFSHLREMGRTTDVRLLTFGYQMPPQRIRDALRMEADERVQVSVRVRHVDGEPFSYLTASVPERIGRNYSRDELATVPLLRLIERSGFRAEHACQDISAALASPDVADALDLTVGAPLISLTRVVYGPDGEGLEHLHALYRPDRYSLHMDLVRTRGDGDSRWSPATSVPAASLPAEPER
ncbi:GntR family transcriptional regulator [Acuticoccus sp. I52.16.1]|uniref:GntR family transcriptional regulator n=1 Tax=Acuticoccus sp. I52.16.1 TaxID=2928472 RepID=UPI001FD25D4C|nr:GntR family transcriptional regulator [Acuticoccus sp. I52.16.1]UOM36146.1 GntR family transcriptional regulator [Acuticoccus sp. I52.16.1]